MDKPPVGFVALKSLKQQAPPDAAAALAEIRKIYFTTTRQTIEADFIHALELLKHLPDEDTREKATVFMHGLSEMQREWQATTKKRGRKEKKATSGGGGKGRIT